MRDNTYEMFQRTKEEENHLIKLQSLMILHEKCPKNTEMSFEYAKELILSGNKINLNLAHQLLTGLLLTDYARVALIELAKIERNYSNYQESINLLLKVINNKDVSRFERNKALTDIIISYIKIDNITDAYQYHQLLDEEVIPRRLYNNLKYYLQYKMGIIDADDVTMRGSYFGKQLLNYSQQELYFHVIKHFNGNSPLRFDKDVSIDDVMRIVNDCVDNKYYTFSFFGDYYNVKFPNKIATVNQMKTSSMEIITFPNDKRIITFYPVLDRVHYKKINLPMKKILQK